MNKRRDPKFIQGYKIKKLVNKVSAAYFAGAVHRCDEILIRSSCEKGTSFVLALLKNWKNTFGGLGA